MRELKKYALRAARKPQNHSLLSGVVHVKRTGQIGYAYIRFDESFVDAVGRSLPYGLSAEHPAFLKWLYMPTTGKWRLFAMYLDESRGAILWESDQLPHWISNVNTR